MEDAQGLYQAYICVGCHQDLDASQQPTAEHANQLGSNLQGKFRAARKWLTATCWNQNVLRCSHPKTEWNGPFGEENKSIKLGWFGLDHANYQITWYSLIALSLWACHVNMIHMLLSHSPPLFVWTAPLPFLLDLASRSRSGFCTWSDKVHWCRCVWWLGMPSRLPFYTDFLSENNDSHQWIHRYLFFNKLVA
jgi:hypothetical protein